MQLYKQSLSFATSFWPEYSFAGSVGDLIQSYAAAQLRRQTIYLRLSVAEQQKRLTEATDIILGEVKKSLGVEFSPTISVADVLYEFVIKQFSEWFAKFGNIVRVVWIVGLYFAMRSVGVIVGWISSLLSYLLVEFLVSTKIAKVKSENQLRETVEL